MHNAFFRPYVSKTTPSSSENISDEQEFEQTLLLVMQEEWQKHILDRYGNTVSLIDATYKTTQYDLTLFSICMRTNVGYKVVAEFVIQFEQTDKIYEAIEVIKQWNQNVRWKSEFDPVLKQHLQHHKKCLILEPTGTK